MAKTSEVRMSLEDYNELHSKLLSYERVFKVANSYDNNIEVQIDFRPILDK